MTRRHRKKKQSQLLLSDKSVICRAKIIIQTICTGGSYLTFVNRQICQFVSLRVAATGYMRDLD